MAFTELRNDWASKCALENWSPQLKKLVRCLKNDQLFAQFVIKFQSTFIGFAWSRDRWYDKSVTIGKFLSAYWLVCLLHCYGVNANPPQIVMTLGV